MIRHRSVVKPPIVGRETKFVNRGKRFQPGGLIGGEVEGHVGEQGRFVGWKPVPVPVDEIAFIPLEYLREKDGLLFVFDPEILPLGDEFARLPFQFFFQMT